MTPLVYFDGSMLLSDAIEELVRASTYRNRFEIETDTRLSAEVVVLDDQHVAFRLHSHEMAYAWKVGTAAELFEEMRNHPCFLLPGNHTGR